MTNAQTPSRQAIEVANGFAALFGDDKKATAAKTGDTMNQGKPQIPYPIALAVAERQKTAKENLSATLLWKSFWRIIGTRRACRRPP